MPWSGSYGYRFTTESLLAYAPLEPGVFGLYNEGGWVFIGKTLNLRKSLISCETQKSRHWQDEEPTGYTFEVCSEAECEELRDQLILEYVPYIPPILPEVPKETIRQPDNEPPPPDEETIWQHALSRQGNDLAQLDGTPPHLDETQVWRPDRTPPPLD